jgi:xylan 1,4-beta-xylosidase
VFGEDPVGLAAYIYEYGRGMQEGEDSRFIKLVSTAKHFSAYDLENWGGNNRFSFTANVSLQDLVQYFWVPFEAATRSGRVNSIMCSYNAVNMDGAGEIPSCAWGWANNEVMRGEWGWDGFIVSDCGAVRGIYEGHQYVNDLPHAAQAGLRGGTDVNCGDVYGNNIAEAYSQGLITIDDLVLAGQRFFTVAFATGQFDDPDSCIYNTYGADHVDRPASRELAKEAAVQGIVLLANNVVGAAPLLPLDAGSLRGKTVAVIGPNANTTQGLLSIYEGSNTLVNNQSVYQAMQRRGAQEHFHVTYAEGCSPTCSNQTGFAEAEAVASSADLVVLVVGLYPGHVPDGGPAMEAEGVDRVNLTLPNYQESLISAIVATGKPVVSGGM